VRGTYAAHCSGAPGLDMELVLHDMLQPVMDPGQRERSDAWDILLNDAEVFVFVIVGRLLPGFAPPGVAP
jgi:hypothetical protein